MASSKDQDKKSWICCSTISEVSGCLRVSYVAIRLTDGMISLEIKNCNFEKAF